MGWNTPDDCPWPSDIDYYNSRGQHPEGEEEPEEDEFDGFDDLGALLEEDEDAAEVFNDDDEEEPF